MFLSDALSLRERRSGTKLDGEINFAMTSLSADVFQGSERNIYSSQGSIAANMFFAKENK